jgi:hypothetical protein
VQDLQGARHVQRAPQKIALADAAADTPREHHLLNPQTTHYCAGRAEIAEDLEHHRNAVADLAVGVQHDPAGTVIDQTDGQGHLQLTAARLVQDAALQAGLKDVQFGLAHRALQAQQQPVVEARRVVDPVLVEDQGARHRRQFEQPMPVGVVARQARDLQPQHDAGVPQRHLGDQVLEAVTLTRLGTGQAQIAVDDVHPLDGPAQRDRTLAQRVLALGALGVLEHLAQRRLANVQERVATKMVGADLHGRVSGHGGPPTLLPAPCRPANARAGDRACRWVPQALPAA